jgi:hypothetical protein
MADANSCQWIRSQWWLTEDQRDSVTRSQYVRLVNISEVVAVQAPGNFPDEGKIFRKFLPDAAKTAYDLDASNLSISCESEEPISSYFGRGSSLQKRIFETELGAPRL